MTFLLGIQRRFAGRVATLAAAISLSAIVSLVLLQLTSRVLDATDYGAYALLMALTTLVSAALDGGAAMLMPLHYKSASPAERGRIFASVALFGAIGACVGGILLCGFWLWQYGPISATAMTIILTAVLMPIRVVTNVALVSFSTAGRSGAIAAQMALQAPVVFATTLIALFGFELGGASLFVGAACGQAVALCVCLSVLGYHRELGLPSRRWLREAMCRAPTTGASGFVEGSRGFGESAMLSAASGLHAIGILSHARLYFSLLVTMTGAVFHNIWSKTLEDAGNPRSNFEMTRRAWTPVQIAISCAAIVFVFLGKDIVGFISNEKLTEAATYIPMLFITALIQVTQQPAAAVVSVSRWACHATWLRMLLTVGNLLALFPTITFFGVGGIVAVCVVEAAAYRLALYLLARRVRPVPFQDEIALIGCVVGLAATACEQWVTPPIGVQLILIIACIAVVVLAGRRSIAEVLAAGRELAINR